MSRRPSIHWLARIFRDPPEATGKAASLPTLVLLLFWSLISLLAFSLVVSACPADHTTINHADDLFVRRAVGYVVESVNWASLRRQKAFLTLILAFCPAHLHEQNWPAPSSVTTRTIPGQRTWVHLQGHKHLPPYCTRPFGVLASGVSLFFVFKHWTRDLSASCAHRGLPSWLSFTFRAAYRAAYINSDNAKEFLVYAHSTREI